MHPNRSVEMPRNIVLVHGAWADGSSWSKVIRILQNKGFNVSAPQIPLTSLADDVAVVRRTLEMQSGPVVLAGHSYGGAVISAAASATLNVEALVYISGWGLDEGESIDSLARQGPPAVGGKEVYPDAHEFLWIKREGFARAFAADVDPAESRVMAAVQKPLSVKSFVGKLPAPAWKQIPSWFLISGIDQMIPPSLQEFMARRMNATIRVVAGSHSSLVSHAEETAAIIMDAAEPRAVNIPFAMAK